MLPSTVQASNTLKVIVSIGPQKYFVEKIGGDFVDVFVMVLPGYNPATYEPKPQQMVGLTRAKIYFSIGVAFENIWLEKFEDVNPTMSIIDTAAGIEKIPMEAQCHHVGGSHNHKGEEHAHHGTEDPHIWLSPPLVKIQSRNILDAFLSVDPENRQKYIDNYNNFVKETVDLDRRIRNIFSEKGKGAKFMVYHPSWGYFAKSYGLEQVCVETEGKEPKARQIQKLIQMATEEKVKVIFIQPQFSKKSANTIAKAIGCRVMVADPLAVNWGENLLNVAGSIRASID